ncbi:efflux RND transporter permease subunit, partial [Candidatus Riflebacteria bacterium]
AIGIPFSFLFTMVLLRIMGQSFNVITILAFVLVSGIIVDDAVIILENIDRHLHLGKERFFAIIDGVSEIALPIISSALTTILAFVPMLIMTGSSGEFFAIIPKGVCFALIASIFEALFILPIHVLDWGRDLVVTDKAGANHDASTAYLRRGIFAPLWQIYSKLLRFLLDHKFLALGSVSVAFFVAIAMLFLSVTGKVPFIKVEFFPGSVHRYHVAVIMPSGTAVETTDKYLRKVARFILSFGPAQAESAAAHAGFYEDYDYTRHRGERYGEVIVTLPPREKLKLPENPRNDSNLHLSFIRDKLKTFTDANFPQKAKRPFIKVFPENDGPPTGKPVNIRITGDELPEVIKAVDAIVGFLKTEKKLKDLKDLEDNRAALRKIFKILPRKEAVHEYGLLPDRVNALVAGALNGRYIRKYRTGDEEVDLVLRLGRKTDEGTPFKTGLGKVEEILDFPIVEHSTRPLYVRDLVSTKWVMEPDIKTRYNRKPAITISANIKEGSSLGAPAVNFMVEEFFKKIKAQYPGVVISFGGEFETTRKSFTSLAIAFCIAVLGIFLVLSSQFNDYFQPLIIISAIPFSIIGVVFGMFISASTFTVNSFLAVVGLAGVAVNNSIILIDFMNSQLREGKELRKGIIEACAARMRPVLITTITTILALLPMVFGIPYKSITWSTMATAFVAGLSSATILSLLFVPVEFELYENMKKYCAKRARNMLN